VKILLTSFTEKAKVLTLALIILALEETMVHFLLRQAFLYTKCPAAD